MTWFPEDKLTLRCARFELREIYGGGYDDVLILEFNETNVKVSFGEKEFERLLASKELIL